MSQIAIGSHVELHSGGLGMTVETIDGEMASVVWTDGKRLLRDKIPLAALRDASVPIKRIIIEHESEDGKVLVRDEDNDV